MRKLLFAGLLALAACDGPDMDVFVGHSESTLRDALGVPTAVVSLPGGMRVLSYRLDEQYAALPTSGPLDGTGPSTPLCTTNFTIRDGMVIDLSRFGPNCPAQG